MIRVLFVTALLLSGAGIWTGSLFAQVPAEKKTEEKSRRKKIRHLSDSTWKTRVIITDTSSALIINRIEDINQTLNASQEVLEKGYDTNAITEDLPRYQRSMGLIKYRISSLSGSQNIRNLSLLQDILDDMVNDLKDWQTALLSYYTQLVSINAQMRTISIDSTLRNLPADSSLRQLYLRQTNELKARWQSTDTTTKQALLKIDKLQSTVTSLYLQGVDLQRKVANLEKAYYKQIFTKEHGYLWQAPESAASRKPLSGVLEESVIATVKVLQYYLKDNWAGRVTALVLTVFFFFWTYFNLRKIKRRNQNGLDKFKYVRSIPIFSTLVFLFTIAPFLDLDPPVVFVQIMQLFQVAALTFLLVKRWPKHLFLFWLVLFALGLFHGAKGAMVSSTYSSRLWVFVIDLFSIWLGWRFLGLMKERREFFPSYMRSVAILYIFLNGLGVLCNLFGRVTLAQVFGNTAISSFIQAIALVIFIQIFLEAIELQLEADKKSTRFTAYLNYQNVELRLRRILTVIAGVFWFVNLTQNLNIYNASYDAITNFLNTPRSVGSTSFTLGSVVIFFFIIWIANIMQKYIGYFFGDTDHEIMPDKKTRLGTSILLLRLVVLTAGFLLGILASGIPLDKVTIVIGALGVGIGLGLQNIVNNLVSGVILAIERPIQVGDLIEIGTNSGRVKDIGIRSSRIVTPDGAEVIIPNGDMLSQRLTNWTLSNTHKRVEIDLKLGEGADPDKALQVILSILKENQGIMPKPEPQVLFQSITQDSSQVQIFFWVYDINRWTQLKSDTLQKIVEAFRKENIPVTG